MAVVVQHITHVEGEDLILLARPEAGGSTLFRSEVSAATLNVYLEGSDTALDTKTLTLSTDPTGAAADDNCMFADAAAPSGLQTDSTWSLDGGYTFWAAVRDTEQHLDGGQTYRVEVTLTAGHTSPTWPQRNAYGDLLFIWHVTVTPTASA